MTTKADLAKQLRETYIINSHKKTVLFIDVFLEVISEALSKGERIELRGFGTFFVKKQATRKTTINNNMTIPEHGKVVFQPCEALRRAAWNCGKGKK